jgi:hypothetical protein
MMAPEVIERFWSKVEKTDGCWLWKAKSKDWDGYGLFSANGRSVRAHRFSWQLANGRKPGKMLVCHRCDNPACVRPDHLFLGTACDNFRDCLAKGRYSPKGTGNAAAKIKEADVPKIRNLYATGQWSQQAIADIFGITQTAVSSIVRGKHWRHLDAA